MAQAGVSWQALRAQAQARAAALGAPTSRLEAWRYVDVRALDAGLGAPLATAQALARLKDLPGTGPDSGVLLEEGNGLLRVQLTVTPFGMPCSPRRRTHRARCAAASGHPRSAR